MNNFLKNKYFLLICRVIIAFIFIYAGAEKISNPESFAVSISNYKILPTSLINIFAITLPWIELVSGVLLLLGIFVKENSIINLSLLFVFTLAIIISMFRGLNIDCGCFGADNKIGLLKLIENSLMILATFLLARYGSDFLRLKS
jgi:uncharacterized membrane protein YphA (DoxX/SURF4 family)